MLAQHINAGGMQPTLGGLQPKQAGQRNIHLQHAGSRYVQDIAPTSMKTFSRGVKGEFQGSSGRRGPGAGWCPLKLYKDDGRPCPGQGGMLSSYTLMMWDPARGRLYACTPQHACHQGQSVSLWGALHARACMQCCTMLPSIKCARNKCMRAYKYDFMVPKRHFTHPCTGAWFLPTLCWSMRAPCRAVHVSEVLLQNTMFARHAGHD